jgi:hypothetical protein
MEDYEVWFGWTIGTLQEHRELEDNFVSLFQVYKTTSLKQGFDLTHDRIGNTIQRFEDFYLKNGSSQGQNLALTVLYVPSLLDSGPLQEHTELADNFVSLFQVEWRTRYNVLKTFT